MNQKQQIVHIHGGMAFNSFDDFLKTLKTLEFDKDREKKSKERWARNYQSFLPDRYDILNPSMPCGDNASYQAWKIWFEKIIPHLEPQVILVGHSLGGSFLAKYLSEENFPLKIEQLHLVSAVYDYEDEIEQLGDFRLDNFPGKLSKAIIGDIYLYHSQDDDIVPFDEVYKFYAQLGIAQLHTFTDRGHFLGESFPELFENIQKRKS